jgi:hypothetical protein
MPARGDHFDRQIVIGTHFACDDLALSVVKSASKVPQFLRGPGVIDQVAIQKQAAIVLVGVNPHAGKRPARRFRDGGAVAAAVGVLAGVKAGLSVKSWVGVEARPAVAASVGSAVPVGGEVAAGTEVKVITVVGVGVEAAGEGARVGDATRVSTAIARTTGVGVLVATTIGLGVLVGVGVGWERATALYPTTSPSMMISPAVAMAIAKKTHPNNKMPLRKLIGNCLSDNRWRGG